MKNFLGLIETEFLPLTEEGKLEKMTKGIMSTTLKNTPPITKKSLDDAPEFIQDIFLPITGDNGLPTFEDMGGFVEEKDTAVVDPVVEVDFKGSVDKFVNRLLLNINR